MFRRAVFSLGLLMLVGCADESVQRNPSNSVRNSANSAMSQPQIPELSDSPGQAYPPQIVSDFMQSCTKGESIRQLGCGCTITNVQKTMSLRNYIRVNQSILEGNPLPVQMKQIFSTCNQQAMVALQNAQNAQQLQSQSINREQLDREYFADNYRSNMAMQRAMIEGANQQSQLGTKAMGQAMTTRYGGAEDPQYPCDYSNQRDSMGRYCGDRAATVRPGGRQ
jgi:hypothetical protein